MEREEEEEEREEVERLEKVVETGSIAWRLL